MKVENVYEDHELEIVFANESRIELREKVVNEFLSENPGYLKDGKRHVTRYKYFVEKISDGRRVYLVRPAFLKIGFDFQVWVERMGSEKDEKPKHEHIFNDLRLKQEENPMKISLLIDAIDNVWNCHEPDSVIGELGRDFNKGFPVELLLKILKWLFIEQDIRYWNYEGRGKLRSAINECVNQNKIGNFNK